MKKCRIFAAVMTFQQFHQQFSSFGCVTTEQLREADCAFDKNSLTRWCQNGYLVKVRNGLYLFPEFLENSEFQYFIANSIYPDSYVSLHSALTYHGYLPNPLSPQLSSITIHKTKEFRNILGNFDYRKVKSELFFGYEEIGEKPFSFLMATPEKALLDLFYLFPIYYDTEQKLRNFAIDERKIFENWDSRLMYEYLQLFENQALENRVSIFAKMYGL